MPFSIIMFDIDHFKKINDQFGHSAGDVILKGVVDCCVEKIRREDFFVRWGGEEFIIILTNTRMQGAYLIAEKLRLALVQKIWPNDIKVNASFSVTQHQTGERINSMIQRADKVLYKAKEAGRNQSFKES
ncbi:MAG: diguanylate cyclase (GGDEF)-like protein [Gammaproteobacteria bacterium]